MRHANLQFLTKFKANNSSNNESRCVGNPFAIHPRMVVVEGVTALATPVEVGGEGDQLTPMVPPQSPSPGTAGVVTKTVPFSWHITIKHT